MELVKKMLQEHGIDIEPIEMESDGCYISELDKIFINSSLSPEEAKKVIYHEIKHVLDHKEFSELYKIFYFRSKMEYEADCHMIKNLLDDFIEHNHLDPADVNIFAFIEYFGLDTKWEPMLKKTLLDKVNNALYV